METKLQEVIHLYLGCKGVESKEGLTCIFSGFDLEDTFPIKLSHSNHTYIEVAQDYFKPILRPLHDIKENEIVELFSFIGGGTNTFRKDKAKDFSPREFVYLLKQGFDLFGLIESGQAIDKTKIQNNDGK